MLLPKRSQILSRGNFEYLKFGVKWSHPCIPSAAKSPRSKKYGMRNMKYIKQLYEWILFSPSSFIVLLLLTWYIYVYIRSNIVHTQQTGVQNSSFLEKNVWMFHDASMTNSHSSFHCWAPWNIAILKITPTKKDKAAFCLFFLRRCAKKESTRARRESIIRHWHKTPVQPPRRKEGSPKRSALERG